jgi:small GTP-binding protein
MADVAAASIYASNDNPAASLAGGTAATGESLTKFKALVIGDSGVGKSNLLLRFAQDKYESAYLSTVGVDYYNRTVSIDGESVQLQMWDTAGQERFRTITRSYYRGSQGILVAYDVTNDDSFENVKHWLGEIERNAGRDVITMLVGNKSDLESSRRVTYQRGKEFADSMGIGFFETSAKENRNVEAVFKGLAKQITGKLRAAAAAADTEAGRAVSVGQAPSAEAGACGLC